MRDILNAGFAALGITADARAAERFEIYHRQLCETNKVMNLTGITEKAEVARLHFLDSAALLCCADISGKRVVDVGTGAGFPGLPLKILRPDADVTLLDSLQKRIGFLADTCEKLELQDVVCLQERAEEAVELREKFDYAVSRAVARLNTLCELCLPFVRVGGAFLAMKGPEPQEEMAQAQKAVGLLGGAFSDTFYYEIPDTDVRHSVVIVRKVAATPAKYPRRFAKIQKSPL